MQFRTISCLHGRRSHALSRALLALALAASLLSGLPVAAQSPVPDVIGAPETPLAATLLDVTISLHSKPDTAAKKEPYERIIRYFADGVYEASNGADKIRTVRIYTGGRSANRADVVWVASCHPNGAVSGRGTAGMHINMCDKFGTYDFLADDDKAKGGGYTLAHEWGHYFYSMYDEYVGVASYDSSFTFPHSTDVAVPNSIMNSQWNATGGSFAWLNFSTPISDTRQTAQHRVYGASAWPTLVRPVADDPRDGQRSATPQRLLHSELAAVAPGAGSAPAINLPGDARSDLKIVWVEDVIYQIVIDHSGSMDSEDKLANAKTAAKLLVDLAELEASVIGVIQFDDSVSTVQPLTPVKDQAVKNTIKAQIDTIGSGGNTAIGDAAQFALDGLMAYTTTLSSAVVFLLSDGQQNSGTQTPLGVTPAYIAAGVPLFTFGYGSDADGSTLSAMALATGGNYYFSPTSLAELSKVFQDANERVSSSIGILAGLLQLLPGTPSSAPFPVDGTLGQVAVAVTYPGAPGAVSLSLLGPGGTPGPAPTCSASASDTLCTFDLNGPNSGQWTLMATAAGAPATVEYRISGRGDDVFTYAASLNVLGGSEVTYPQPIVLLAILGKELPISGAGVTAEMHTPSGAIVQVALRDDGVAPDAVAQDGLYSAIVSPSGDGVYNISVQFDNSQGTAAMTEASLAPSIGADGLAVPLAAPIPVGENFERFARAQVTVKGTMNDDHGNNAGAASGLPADNTDKPGRIDYAGDVDFFRLEMPGSGAAVARVAQMALGMNPRLRIYAADGATLLTDSTLASHGNARGYVSVALGATPGSVLYLAVSQVGDQQVGGTYAISAGASLPDDAAASARRSVYLPAVARAVAQALPLINGDFEAGPSVGWTSYSSGGYALIVPSSELGFDPASGSWAAWLGGAPNETASIEQQVTVVPGQSVLHYYYVVGSKEDVCGNDKAAVLINGSAVESLDLCRAAMTGEWTPHQIDLGAYTGQTVTLAFRAVLDGSLNSNFFVDLVSLGASAAGSGGVDSAPAGPLPPTAAIAAPKP